MQKYQIIYEQTISLSFQVLFGCNTTWCEHFISHWSWIKWNLLMKCTSLIVDTLGQNQGDYSPYTHIFIKPHYRKWDWIEAMAFISLIIGWLSPILTLVIGDILRCLDWDVGMLVGQPCPESRHMWWYPTLVSCGTSCWDIHKEKYTRMENVESEYLWWNLPQHNNI